MTTAPTTLEFRAPPATPRPGVLRDLLAYGAGLVVAATVFDLSPKLANTFDAYAGLAILFHLITMASGAACLILPVAWARQLWETLTHRPAETMPASADLNAAVKAQDMMAGIAPGSPYTATLTAGDLKSPGSAAPALHRYSRFRTRS